jgi:hypothetical protein
MYFTHRCGFNVTVIIGEELVFPFLVLNRSHWRRKFADIALRVVTADLVRPLTS